MFFLFGGLGDVFFDLNIRSMAFEMYVELGILKHVDPWMCWPWGSPPWKKGLALHLCLEGVQPLYGSHCCGVQWFDFRVQCVHVSDFLFENMPVELEGQGGYAYEKCVGSRRLYLGFEVKYV